MNLKRIRRHLNKIGYLIDKNDQNKERAELRSMILDCVVKIEILLDEIDILNERRM